MMLDDSERLVKRFAGKETLLHYYGGKTDEY